MQDAKGPLDGDWHNPIHRSGSRIRVVVSDNSDTGRDQLANLLGEECEVIGRFSDSETLIGAVSELCPDVAVLNIAVSSYISVLDTIRVISEKSPGTKVVVFSAYKDEACVRATRDAGARAYVLKSEPRALIPSIRAVVRGESRFPGAL